MIESKDSLDPKDWIGKAKKDARRVVVLLADNDVEGAGFHLQQAIEKYLKAYLISKGWKLEYIHDLVKLLNYAVKHNPDFERFRTLCKWVTDQYIIDRYPLFGMVPPAKEEIEKVNRESIDLFSKIDKELEK